MGYLYSDTKWLIVKSKIFSLIEEQVAVKFTGKINILSSYNRQFLGHILFIDGSVVNVSFQKHSDLKALYHLIIIEDLKKNFDYVIEPEVVEEKERHIHYPFSVLKKKLTDVLGLYHSSEKIRPPAQIRFLIKKNFMVSHENVTPEEFEVLKVVSEWSDVENIYNNCQLLDHEITLALVALRKKGAFTLMSPAQDG